jgi:hypothetical protein
MREVKGWALESWGTITRDPWMRIAGRRERLLGSLEASLSLPIAPQRPDRGAAKARV